MSRADLNHLPAQIRTIGDPLLRQSSESLSTAAQAEQQVAADCATVLLTTLRASRGVGISAVQIGLPIRIVVLEDKAVPKPQMPSGLYKRQRREPFASYAIVNPELTPVVSAGESVWFEGCLSVPNYTAAVPRWNEVLLRGLSVEGQPIRRTVSGWEARILQHELDHLQGGLYIDRMVTSTFMPKEAYEVNWRDKDIKEVLAAFASTAATQTGHLGTKSGG